MDTFCTLVIPVIINIALIATTIGIWQCINTVEVTLEESLQTGDNFKNITRSCNPQNLFLKDDSETPSSVWMPKNTGELFDHGRPVLERSYKATKIVVYITICYGFFGIFILIAPRFICTINSNKKETLDSILRTIRLIELGICGAVLIGASALLIASTIKITNEFTASPDLCAERTEILDRIITKCCGNCEAYERPKGHSVKPSMWEICTQQFIDCLEEKRHYFREYCKDISVFVVGMMGLMFSNACFFLSVWVTVWCRNEWNYAEDDENVFDKPRTVRISHQPPVQYSEVPQEHVFNNENKDQTENNHVTFAQPNGGTPMISKGPGFQRKPHDDYDLQSNDYFYDDQISNIRAMENSLTEAESLQRNRKKQFSVNEPQDLMSGSFTR